MQIEPQTTIPLVYQLTDPYDAGTYYVRAVMRDSMSGVALGQKDLVAQGNGRYKSEIPAPQDGSGFGRHIDVTISVYTDAGFSVYSENYEHKIDKYLVKRTVSLGGGGGWGGGGVDVDYDKIRKIMVQVLKNVEDGVTASKVDLDPVYLRIGSMERAVLGAIGGIEIPKFEQMPVNFDPIMTALQTVASKITDSIIENKPEKPDPVDLTPVLTEIEAVRTNINALKTTREQLNEAILEEIRKVFKSSEAYAAIQALVTQLGETKKKVETFEEVAGEYVKKPATEKPATPPVQQEKPEKKRNPEIEKYFPKR